ncbi:MAG: bifunctional 4-hydroxy-2-oxoglutarate aldolase/2-dehydro-3-deoxy-phosphogluconate aldolase, partial [Spirochaetia bacterium]
VPYMPGCGTVSEIQQAHALGVEICKIFPAAAVGGPAFVKAVMGPCPWTSLMPTGGVNPTRESLSAWFEAGVSCVGMGSKLITRELLAKKDFQGISKNIKNALSIIRECKARGTA